METTKTNRGFGLIEFQDRNRNACSLQASSLATEAAIWFGCNEIGFKSFAPHTGGWKSHSEGELKKMCGPNVDSVLANTRMHLTQEQVKELLPHFIKFAETGEI